MSAPEGRRIVRAYWRAQVLWPVVRLIVVGYVVVAAILLLLS